VVGVVRRPPDQREVSVSNVVPGDPHLTFLQSIVLGAMQGVTELFPVSSLGHTVLIPALIGGSWKDLVTQQSEAESPYLAFIVGLHVATALALLCFFWRDWVRIIAGFLSSIRKRRLETVHEKMAWLIIVATIPAGILGLTLEHALRTLFAKPEAAATFLTINGVILFTGERLRRKAVARRHVPVASPAGVLAAGSDAALDADLAVEPDPAIDPLTEPEHDPANDAAVTKRVSFRDAGFIGVLQSLALLAGISRSGVTMVAGLLRGLDHEQAVRFSFLLATPIILAAGLLKVPDLFGPLGDGIRGQALAGSVAAFIAALISTKFLTRWFRTRTLTPFAVYCGGFGIFCLAWFA
jgi:undecaprenyl-diphosphatase